MSGKVLIFCMNIILSELENSLHWVYYSWQQKVRPMEVLSN
jgi:hypothetical protein